MLKKYYLSKSEIELIQIALGELIIFEKKKEIEDRVLINKAKDLMSKMKGNVANEKNKKKK